MPWRQKKSCSLTVLISFLQHMYSNILDQLFKMYCKKLE